MELAGAVPDLGGWAARINTDPQCSSRSENGLRIIGCDATA
jgi:hypothetical protein